MIKKIAGWAVVVFIAWFLITNPHSAAAAVTNLKDAAVGAATSLATFFTSL